MRREGVSQSHALDGKTWGDVARAGRARAAVQRRDPGVNILDLHRKTQPAIMRVFLPDALWQIRSEFCSAGCYVA